MSNFATYEQLLEISNKISKKVPQGIMLGNTQVGHIEWQMYLQRDYLKLDGTPLANASNDYDELLKFAQDNSLITSDTTDKSLFKYNSTTDVLILPNYVLDSGEVGSILSYMGNNVPIGCLACDGTIYNITDYPDLAEHINTQFGSYNYFGGNGATTFAVPDLRGEFLRGTGTNSHTNQGNGANVGTHQDGTRIPKVLVSDTFIYSNNIPPSGEINIVTGADKETKLFNGNEGKASRFSETWTSADNSVYTSRPTNTSVLYCIRYKTTLIPQIKYIKGTTVWEELDFNKLMPLGTVINFMGTIAPDYYLACDGTIYNILEYSALANFFEVQFGSKNFFGGDGTTTFAVPDLRGEFLRGTGTNSHINGALGTLEGSGSSVGTHQPASTINNIDSSGKTTYIHNTTTWTQPAFMDAKKISGMTGEFNLPLYAQQDGSVQYYTTRPTNTSVLYCIKYK